MTIRKCIYTSKPAESKDNVIPKRVIREESHNWANKAPISKEYKDFKQDRLPTELEMEANRLFHLLELAKMDVVYYEAKLLEIQEIINKNYISPEKKEKKSKKDKEIEQAIMEREAASLSDDAFEEILSKKKDLWE